MVNQSTDRFRVVMKDYPEQVQVSARRQPKYWKPKDKLPKFIQKMILDKVATWHPKGKNQELRLYDVNSKEFIIKNKRVAGTPRFVTINSQLLWEGGSGSEWTRRAVEQFLKEWYIPAIRRQLPEKIWTGPGVYLQLEFIFYCSFPEGKTRPQDYINHSFIRAKVFEDTLVEMGVIPDDNPNYLRGGYFRYVQIPEDAERHMDVIFHFCKNDERICHSS